MDLVNEAHPGFSFLSLSFTQWNRNLLCNRSDKFDSIKGDCQRGDGRHSSYSILILNSRTRRFVAAHLCFDHSCWECVIYFTLTFLALHQRRVGGGSCYETFTVLPQTAAWSHVSEDQYGFGTVLKTLLGQLCVSWRGTPTGNSKILGWTTAGVLINASNSCLV